MRPNAHSRGQDERRAYAHGASTDLRSPVEYVVLMSELPVYACGGGACLKWTWAIGAPTGETWRLPLPLPEETEYFHVVETIPR